MSGRERALRRLDEAREARLEYSEDTRVAVWAAMEAHWCAFSRSAHHSLRCGLSAASLEGRRIATRNVTLRLL